MDTYEKFKNLMEEYNELLDRLLDLEEAKIKIIASGGSVGLNSCMKDEEAEMLRMKGLDRKREKLLEETNQQGKTFREIVDMQAAVQKTELQPLYIDMREKTHHLKKLTESTAGMIESRLIRVEHTIREMNGSNTYGKDGHIVKTGEMPKTIPVCV
jgi:hypothetical protein